MEKRIQPIEKRKELINRFKKQKALNDKNKKQIFENLNNFQLSIHPDAIEWYESTRVVPLLMSNEKKSVVFSINDANWGNTTIPYPETIYLDANPIIDIALDRENSDLVKSFLTSVTQQDGVIFWSSHTKQEVTRVLHASEYSKYADLNGITKRGNTPSWKMAENKMTSYQSSQLNKSVLQKRDELFSLLENLGLEVTANDYNDTVVHRSAETLYSTYGGSIEDAKHVAIANSIGVNDILSHDKGFLNYPNLNIYGNSYAITRKFLMNAKPNDFIDINSFTLIKKEAK